MVQKKVIITGEKEIPKYTYAGVFFLSLSCLCYEVLACRINSIAFTHNYAFLVAAIALLGMGLGSIYVFYRWKKGYPALTGHTIAFYSSLYSVSLLLYILLLTRTQVTSGKILYVASAAAPFIFAGASLAAVFRQFYNNSYLIYSIDLIGAAAGSVTAILILNTIGGNYGILFAGFMGAAASLLFALPGKPNNAGAKMTFVVSILVIIICIFNVFVPFLSEIPVSFNPNKSIFKIIRVARGNFRIMDMKWNNFGRTDLLEIENDDRIRFMFIDGDSGTEMVRFSGDPGKSDENIENIKKYSAGFIPMRFLNENQKNSMLIIGPGGGKEVLFGILSGMKNITGVEINSNFVNITKKYSEYNGGIYTGFENVRIITGEGRGYLKGNTQRYDVIMLSLPIMEVLNNFEGYAFSDSYLLTIEAMTEYIEHLNENGLMVFVMHDSIEIARIINTLKTVYKKKGIKENIADSVYSLQVGKNPVLVVKRQPLSRGELENIEKALVDYSRSENTGETVIYLPENTGVGLLKQDAYSRLTRSVISGGDFESAVLGINIEPVTDDKPYFYNFGGKSAPAEISAMFRIAVFFNALVFVSWLVFTERRKFKAGFASVFILLGAGFMFIEVPLLQKLSFFLGSDTVAFSILLSGLLAGMSAGSFAGGRILILKTETKIIIYSFLVSLASTAVYFILPLALSGFFSQPLAVRAAICFVFLVPLGFLSGIPFPAALALVKEEKNENNIPAFYALNSSMSVLGSVGAVVVFLEFGITAALLGGAFCYLLVCCVMLMKKKI